MERPSGLFHSSEKQKNTHKGVFLLVSIAVACVAGKKWWYFPACCQVTFEFAETFGFFEEHLRSESKVELTVRHLKSWCIQYQRQCQVVVKTYTQPQQI